MINPVSFDLNPVNRETERLDAVYQYTIQNFSKKISLDTIARVAHITPNSFCRYFKAHTRKNYNTFLMELRVGHACKLLIENKLNLTQICYKSGFNNPTSFYSAFKRVMGKTPLEYKQHYTKQLPV
jgi:AraC-like DNA-binding protein